ncbi:hypothetical protein LCGC14_1865680 [marine sediment metagenome]|uniref:Uncharacterized protein n=1 Tax=marine sediment metagenome TaxID=412755 RepID=A0A0F9IKP2_9ZZZZ
MGTGEGLGAFLVAEKKTETGLGSDQPDSEHILSIEEQLDHDHPYHECQFHCPDWYDPDWPASCGDED